jgi:wyosine [tRNA(Phe)-imidazoG37] synthetase (radical SAM superfamily)
MIENCALNFNGRIDTGGKCMTLCCENVSNIPGTGFGDTAAESIENFRRERAELIAESVRLELLGDANAPRKFTSGCAECANFQQGDFGNFDGLIHYVNLSMYPAPCQCKCIYCGVHSGESGAFNKKLHSDCYDKLFEMLEYAKQNGIIAPNATWQVSSGEIAIHPYKDRILDLVKGCPAVFYTNCFIFEERVAENLKTNPNSAINLSIDSGTPSTWRAVKGVDNFDAVTDNLVKYYNGSARPGQITLKYIVLPGTNDNLADYLSVIEIMKVLGVKHLTLSRDTRIKYAIEEGENETLIGAAGYFTAMLHKNGLTFDMFTYTPQERESVIAFARDLLQSGKV